MKLRIVQEFIKLKNAEKPIIEKFQQAHLEHIEELKKLAEPFHLLLEEYYDTFLLDKNGNIVKCDHIIVKQAGKTNIKYQVVERSLQVIFGEIMWNPSVGVKRLNKESVGRKGGRLARIHPSELKQFEVINIEEKK